MVAICAINATTTEVLACRLSNAATSGLQIFSKVFRQDFHIRQMRTIETFRIGYSQSLLSEVEQIGDLSPKMST